MSVECENHCCCRIYLSNCRLAHAMEEQEHSTKLFEHLANRRIVNAMTDPVLVKNYGDVGKQFEFEVRRELT